MKVLIADDSDDVRDRLCEVISKKTRIKVYQAASTQDALDCFKTNRPDLIILDISMPGEGGMYVLEQIRKENPDVMIVMFTNYPIHSV